MRAVTGKMKNIVQTFIGCFLKDPIQCQKTIEVPINPKLHSDGFVWAIHSS